MACCWARDWMVEVDCLVEVGFKGFVLGALGFDTLRLQGSWQNMCACFEAQACV